MKTTTKRKTMRLEFNPTESSGQSYEVFTGQQKLGRVSYVEENGGILVTNIEVEPYLEGFDIESRILDALLADDSVKCIAVISQLSTAAFYEANGFVCDPKQVLLRKTKS